MKHCKGFRWLCDVYIDLQFSTYFVPSKLTAQDGMDVSLQGFEKVSIDGNVSSTILGTAASDTLVIPELIQSRVEVGLIHLLAD